ncbi:MAG: hypothetical protein ACM3N5_16340 [Candidatus Eiseniibacteriota bacterium]
MAILVFAEHDNKALNAPPKRQAGRKVGSVAELVQVLHTEAKVI